MQYDAKHNTHTRMCENVNETTITRWCRVIPSAFLKQGTWFIVLKHKEENARERKPPDTDHFDTIDVVVVSDGVRCTHAIRECPIGNALFLYRQFQFGTPEPVLKG